MVAVKGRSAILKKGATTVAGVRVTGFTAASQPIDITDNDSDGVRELLAGASATDTLDLTVEGVEEDQIRRDIMLNPATDRLLTDVTLTFSDATVLSGNFFLSSYAESNPYQDATTFNASLMSSGSWAVA